MIKKALAIIFLGLSVQSFSQELPLFSHYFLNPYLINPAYAGSEGRGTLFLTHRRQWAGITDAPVTSNLTYHAPLTRGLSFGLGITHDDRSILTSSTVLMTFGYTIQLGTRHFLRFAISPGVGMNNVDFDENTNFLDPAVANLLDQNLYLTGNAGISYHLGNFNVGVALPQIFENQVIGLEDFEVGDISPTDEIVINAAYRFYFGADQFAFEPRGYYRLSQDDDYQQWEAAGIFHIKNAMWLGGAYREDFGVTGLIGFKFKNNLSIGYAINLGVSDFSGFDNLTHEFQLQIGLGKKDKPKVSQAQVYSFIDLERPPKELLAEEDDEEDEVEPEPEPEVEEPEPEEEETEPVIQEDTVRAPIITPPIEQEDEPVIVTRGDHILELPLGHYVIVGAFGNVDNAQNFSDRLFQMGYRASFGFLTEKNLYYVFMSQSNSPAEARAERDRLRNIELFKDAWYLLVQ